MGVYTKGVGNLTLGELHLYGSARLGILNTNIDVQQPVNTNGNTTFIRGNKFFELANHLGNVLVTVSDKKIGVSSNGTTIDYYTADVITANDYAPFGSLMPGRKFAASSSKYRYGFNGKENDKDISAGAQDYGMRIYDSRLGRFLSIDPLVQDYPYYTPYQFAGNSPIEMIDIDGGEGGKLIDKLVEISDAITDFFTFKSEKEEIQQGVSNVREGVQKQVIGPWDWRIYNSDNPGLEFEIRRIDGQIQSATGAVQINSGVQGISQKVQTVVEIPLILKNTSKPVIKKVTSTATNEIKPTTSPKGVNNPKVKEALDYGNKMHKELTEKAKAKGWTTGKKLIDPKTGETVIPDVITPSGHPLEYKPKTPSGIKKGKTQLKGQERATGTNGRVIYYEPKKKT